MTRSEGEVPLSRSGETEQGKVGICAEIGGR